MYLSSTAGLLGKKSLVDMLMQLREVGKIVVYLWKIQWLRRLRTTGHLDPGDKTVEIGRAHV